MKTELSKLMEKYKDYSNKELILMLKEESDLKKFGLLLSYMRRHFLGYTQEELSLRLNVSRGHVLNLEAGRVGPSLKLRRKIVHIFSVQFGFEPKDSDDNIFHAINLQGGGDIDSADIKEIYEQIKERDRKKFLKEAKEENDAANGRIVSIKDKKDSFIMAPPVLDKSGKPLFNLKYYVYEKKDEECELCLAGDVLIINTEKICGSNEDIFLFKNTQDANCFVGRLYLSPDKMGIPQAKTTIIHSFRLISELKNKKIEEPVRTACECIGQIVHISRDVNKISLSFLKG